MAFGGFGGFGGFPAAAAAPVAAPVEKDMEVAMPPGTDSISAIAWSPSSQFIAAASWDNKCYIWEVARQPGTGAPAAAQAKALSPDLGAPVLDVKWTPDGASMFAVGCNNTVKLWNLQANAATDIGRHDKPIKSCHWVASMNVLVTGGWDSTLRYWDPRAPKEVAKVALPERVFAIDLNGDSMVVATADRKLHLFHVPSNPSAPVRSMESPLRFQTRCVRVFHDKKFFGIGSIEGRCAIRCLDEGMDKAVDAAGKSKFSFAFKCHREFPGNNLNAPPNIFSLNSIDAHPAPDHQSVFVTAGADGVFNFWDRDKRQRLKEYKYAGNPAGQVQSIVDAKFNPGGDLLAYAYSYDWSRGAEGYRKEFPGAIHIHHTTAEKDLRRPAGAK